MQTAINVIVRDKTTGNLLVHPDAIKFFSGISHPFGCLGISGPTRSSKSSILNMAILNEQVFEVGSTTDSCTKCVNMAPRLIKGLNADYVVFDSEGTASFDNTNREDLQIVCLMYYMNSMFMYNTMKVDETALSFLSVVAATIQKLRASNPDFKDYPQFVWLLRDFNLLLPKQSNGQHMTFDEYLQKQILGIHNGKRKQPSGSDAEVDEDTKRGGPDFSEMKQVIRESFKSFNCFAFGTPSSDASVLQNLQVMPSHRLNPGFQEKCQELKQFVDARIEAKRYCGKPMTGPLFLRYLSDCVHALNQDTLPVIKNQYSLMAEISCKDGTSQSLSILNKVRKLLRFVKNKYICMSLLQDFVTKLHRHIQKQFLERCFEPEKASTQEYWKQIEMKINEFRTKLMTANVANLQVQVSQALKEVMPTSKLNELKLPEILKHYQTFLDKNKLELEAFLTKAPIAFGFYEPSTTTPVTCSITLNTWLQAAYNLLIDAMTQFQTETDLQLQQSKDEIKKLETECAQIKSLLEIKEKELTQARIASEELSAKYKDMEQTQKVTLFECESLSKDLKLSKEEIHAQRGTLEELSRQMMEQGDAKVEIDSLKSQLNAALTNVQDLEKQALKKESMDAEQWSLLQGQVSELRGKLNEQKIHFETQIRTRDQKIKQQEEVQKSQLATVETLTNKETQLSKKLANKQSHLHDLQVKYDALQAEFRQELNESKKLSQHLLEEKAQVLLKCQNLENEGKKAEEFIATLKKRTDENRDMEKKYFMLQQSEFQLRALSSQKDKDITKLQLENQEKTNTILELKRRMHEIQSSQKAALQAYYLGSLNQKPSTETSDHTLFSSSSNPF